MPNPKITFAMITAREDFPYVGRPELGVFEPTLEAMKAQTMKDFEFVVIDVLYEQRSDYFKNMKLPFHVKHVPAKPNMWIEQGLPGIATQYNKGIIYADGELLFFTGEGFMFQPNFMERLWQHYQDGSFPLAWYFYDDSYVPTNQPEPMPNWKTAYPIETQTPFPYDIAGYSGKLVSLEHRYTQVFKDKQNDSFLAPWAWWFGCSSASLKAMLEVNGFNQNFDGDRMLLDCDVGSRLELAGYGAKLKLFRDTFIIRARPNVNVWNKNIDKAGATIKCNLPLLWHSRIFGHYRANEVKLEDGDVEWMKASFCGTRCDIRDLCRKEHPWQFPFEHKSGYEGHKSSKELFEFWKNHQTQINLQTERAKRIEDNPMYKEGTYT